MVDKPEAPRRSPLVLVFAVLAVAALLAWFLAGFEGCKHAGLV